MTACPTSEDFTDLFNQIFFFFFLRCVGDPRSGVKDFGRILRLNRQHRCDHLARVLWFDVDFELAFTSFLHLGFKIRSRRRDLWRRLTVKSFPTFTLIVFVSGLSPCFQNTKFGVISSCCGISALSVSTVF